MTTPPPSSNPDEVPTKSPSAPPTIPIAETLFRSETMHLYQFIVRNEALYDCVSELGKVGAVQIRDVSSRDRREKRSLRRLVSHTIIAQCTHSSITVESWGKSVSTQIRKRGAPLQRHGTATAILAQRNHQGWYKD